MPFYPESKQKPSPYERVDQGKAEDPLLGEGGPAKPGRVWGGTRSDLVPPLFRRLRAAPSPRGRLRALSCLERVARQSRDGCGGDPWRFKPGPVLCVGWLPSSVRAFGPATFPVGEGFLRRGLPAGGTFPQGKVKGPIFSLSYWYRRRSCHGHGPRSGSGNTPSGCRRWRRSCLRSCPRRRPWPR